MSRRQLSYGSRHLLGNLGIRSESNHATEVAEPECPAQQPDLAVEACVLDVCTGLHREPLTERSFQIHEEGGKVATLGRSVEVAGVLPMLGTVVLLEKSVHLKGNTRFDMHPQERGATWRRCQVLRKG